MTQQSEQQSLDLAAGLDARFEFLDGGLPALRVGTKANNALIARQSEENGLPADSSWWKSFLLEGPGSFTFEGSDKGRVSVVDLFSASGGLSLGVATGLRALGFRTRSLLAADIDAGALEVFKANHRPQVTANRSVTELVDYRVTSRPNGAEFSDGAQLLGEASGLEGEVDLVVGGPPCQGHSTFNNHTRFNDPRNQLYLAVPAFAVAAGAKCVIIENVPGVRASKEGVARVAKELLLSSGYNVVDAVLRADQIGWPQTRSRYFMVASRDWVPIDLGSLMAEFAEPPRPISWALRDLLEIETVDVMNTPSELSLENQKRVNYLHDHDLFELPNDQRPDCHKNGTTYGAVYGRMHWDAPSQTLTTGFLTPGRGRYVHPLRRRTLTLREAARIQGFPDSYRFEVGSGELRRTVAAKWIGDAVPAPLGMIAALSAFGSTLAET